MSNDEITRMSVRFPDPLLNRLRAAALADRRSVHAMLLILLERALRSFEEAQS